MKLGRLPSRNHRSSHSPHRWAQARDSDVLIAIETCGSEARNLRRGRLLLSVMMLLVCPNSCREKSTPQIEIATGGANEQHITFAPKVAFAEYVELPTSGDELRVSLANYDLSCEGYSPVPDNGLLVTLTFLLPVGQRPIAGTYPWPGLPEEVKLGGATFDLKTPIVMPVVRIGKRSMAFLAGGNVDIQSVNLERQGEVTGVMRLEQSGAEGQPATRLFGSFSARVCRSSVPTGTLGP